MLELTRIRKVRVRQDEAFADILLEPVTEPPPAPLAPEVTSPAPETAAATDPAPEMPLETPTIPPTVTA
jgi:hypothetical protein